MRGQILAVDADEGPGAEVGLPEVCSECADHAHVSGPRMHNTDPTPHPDALCFAARRRMRFLIQALEEESVQSLQRTRPIPDFSSGDVLEVCVTLTHAWLVKKSFPRSPFLLEQVRMRIPENQRRQCVYRGICIAR